jgi:hypothetical protein
VTVPSYQWLWSEEDVHAGHFRRYTKASLREAVQGSGFRTERLEYIFASLVAPALLARRLPFLLGQRRGPQRRALAQELHPPAVIASAATTVLRAERALARRVGLPFGLSTAAVFRKPGPGWSGKSALTS